MIYSLESVTYLNGVVGFCSCKTGMLYFLVNNKNAGNILDAKSIRKVRYRDVALHHCRSPNTYDAPALAAYDEQRCSTVSTAE